MLESAAGCAADHLAPELLSLCFPVTPTRFTLGSETNCTRDKLMLGLSAGLLSSLSCGEHHTTRLGAPPAASSLCRGAASDIPIPRKAETSLFSPLGPHFFLMCQSDEHSSCAPFTPRAGLSHPASSSWHQLLQVTLFPPEFAGEIARALARMVPDMRMPQLSTA